MEFGPRITGINIPLLSRQLWKSHSFLAPPRGTTNYISLLLLLVLLLVSKTCSPHFWMLHWCLLTLGKYSLLACIFDIRCNLLSNLPLSHGVTKAIPLLKLNSAEGIFFERDRTQVYDLLWYIYVTSYNWSSWIICNYRNCLRYSQKCWISTW